MEVIAVKSIRSKILITMLGVTVVTSFIIILIFMIYVQASGTSAVESFVPAVSFDVSRSVDKSIDSYNLAVSKVAARISEQTTPAEIKPMFDKEIFVGVGVYSAAGTVDPNSEAIVMKVIDDATLRRALSVSCYCCNTGLVEYEGKYYIGYVCGVGKVDNTSSDRIAVVACLDDILKDINDVSEKSKTDIVVVGSESNKVMLASKDSVISIGTDISADDGLKEFVDAYSSSLESDGAASCKLEGKQRIAAANSLKNIDAAVICYTTTDVFMGIEASTYIIIIVTAVVLIAGTLVVALFFSRNISKPIVSTTDRIRKLAQGNLSEPVDVWDSKDELGILTNSLEETILSLRQYISLITAELTQISEGNLSHRMEGNFKGDFVKIKNTFNYILEALSETFVSINTAAEQVNTGASSVSDSAQVLSQGSTRQASSVEELSATLTGVSKQIRQNSDDAKNAYNIVSENTAAINNCNDDMTNMLSAMEQITEATEEISKIIKVIDEISFQTNILALNAAVEAAREGSKGFGVVADEVRRLASRSAEAAKQTSQLIENSTNAVDRGSEIAKETAKSLEEIVIGSDNIKGLVKNITDASEAQAEAIVQINTGVDQISAVVANNTAAAVGIASASEELSGQSLVLKNMIARFKLSEGASEGVSDYTAPSRSKFDYDDGDMEAPVHASTISKFAYPDDDEEDTGSASKFDYPDDDDEPAPAKPASKFDYPDDDDEPAPAKPASKFDYPDDDDEPAPARPASKFDYPDDDDEPAPPPKPGTSFVYPDDEDFGSDDEDITIDLDDEDDKY
ncbi:MAG: HAMP domain-containing protein [Ruminococcus sp.]|nr:HAMP domain-containing protein [Ruminococcus sp.]